MKNALTPDQRLGYEAGDMKLTPQEEAFAQTYVRTGNGLQAVRDMPGCAVDELTTSQLSWRSYAMRRKPKVQARVRQLQAEARARWDTQLTRVIEELHAIGFASLGDILTTDADGKPRLAFDVDDRLRMAPVKKIKFNDDGTVAELQMHDKLAALDKLGRHLGLYDREQGDPDAKPVSQMEPDELVRKLLAVLAKARHQLGQDARVVNPEGD